MPLKSGSGPPGQERFRGFFWTKVHNSSIWTSPGVTDLMKSCITYFPCHPAQVSQREMMRGATPSSDAALVTFIPERMWPRIRAIKNLGVLNLVILV